MEIKKKKKTYWKNTGFGFSTFDTPNSSKKECKGVVPDFSTNNNTPTITAWKGEQSNVKRRTLTQRIYIWNRKTTWKENQVVQRGE
jgi:hypothetical protein